MRCERLCLYSVIRKKKQKKKQAGDVHLAVEIASLAGETSFHVLFTPFCCGKSSEKWHFDFSSVSSGCMYFGGVHHVFVRSTNHSTCIALLAPDVTGGPARARWSSIFVPHKLLVLIHHMEKESIIMAFGQAMQEVP